MSLSPELLPCPFCGGEAEFERFGTARVSTIYACTECGCRLETGEVFNAGAAWNTRSPSPEAPVEGGGVTDGRDPANSVVLDAIDAAITLAFVDQQVPIPVGWSTTLGKDIQDLASNVVDALRAAPSIPAGETDREAVARIIRRMVAEGNSRPLTERSLEAADAILALLSADPVVGRDSSVASQSASPHVSPSPSLTTGACEPTERELLAEADHFHDEEWESTYHYLSELVETNEWDCERGGEINTVYRLKMLPASYAVNLPQTYDEDGEADDWEVALFATRASAEAAWRKAMPPEDVDATTPASDGEVQRSETTEPKTPGIEADNSSQFGEG